MLAGLADGRWAGINSRVPEQQVMAVERAANAHWRRRENSRAPTVGASGTGGMFATPTPPPPCRSGQDDMQKQRAQGDGGEA